MATAINPQMIRTLSEAIDAALTETGKKYGLTIAAGNARYDDGSVTYKLVCAVVGEDGNVMTPEAGAFKECAKMYGLEPDDLFKEVTINGFPATIVGIKTRSRKYPILCKRKDGKYYKFTAGAVLRALGREVPAWIV